MPLVVLDERFTRQLYEFCSHCKQKDCTWDYGCAGYQEYTRKIKEDYRRKLEEDERRKGGTP